ncbi:4984_t:CDS:2 [Ambispora leptoticha]|uniref:4984_t:CDS:1 n=1 Tax=Ambispora leptoticha TaxID=144679 RepID=A0A9N8WDI5_9GLOM|nr:4984_t:CDS:2 [Ambispora leptoticha]
MKVVMDILSISIKAMKIIKIATRTKYDDIAEILTIPQNQIQLMTDEELQQIF